MLFFFEDELKDDVKSSRDLCAVSADNDKYYCDNIFDLLAKMGNEVVVDQYRFNIEIKNVGEKSRRN